jgi:hypothetical protein
MRQLKVLFTILIIFSISGKVFSQDADEIVNKYISAIGGLDKILAVKTLKYSGKTSVSGMDIPFVQTYKRPLMMLSEVTIQGMAVKQAYDGKTGWFINPLMGKKDPDVMPKDAEKAMVKQADFDGEIVNYKEKGNTIELIGKEDLEGSPVYNVKLTTKDSSTTNYYFDADSYLLIKETDKIKFDTKEVNSEILYSDFKPVDGIMRPFALEVKSPDNPMGPLKIIIEKTEINFPLEDSFFKMPETK